MSLATADIASDAAFRWFLSNCRAPITRPITEWVEQEIVLPTGPYAGERYRHHRHPVSRLWFNELESNRWSRFAATAPTQNGKTLMCYVLPVLYHLFELKETVIVGLPTMEMAHDKWALDFLPVIEASRYRDMLPLKGEGARGGQVKQGPTFRNGAMLRFMTGGGGDKKRAGFTSRVVAITETDGMDEAGEASREADPIEQIEGRTRAFGRHGKRIYLECTVSIERGRIWQEVTKGSNSRIARPCPYCEAWVTPEREHLRGWEKAETEEQAAELAEWVCPECEHAWTEEDRRNAATQTLLVHHGQHVDDGKVVGPEPATQTLGFRWSAIDNPFADAASLGAEEWRAKRSADMENAEKKMRQFIWTLPHEPPEVDLTPLDPEEVRQRNSGLKRGVLPDGCLGIAIGMDTGKRQLNWEAKAIMPDGKSLVVFDYGEKTVLADKLGVYQGLVAALAELRQYFAEGWQTQSGQRLGPSQVWIDSGYHEHTDAVYAFCKVANEGVKLGREIYRPMKGYGEGQQRMQRYSAPAAKTAGLVYIGKEYHIAAVRRNGRTLPGILLVHVNADYWKSEFHQRLVMPAEEPGAITLFEAQDITTHGDYISQITAEKQVEKFMPSRGAVVVWERVNRNNHKLDAAYSATAACHFISAMIEKAAAVAKPRPSARELAVRK